LTLTTQLRAGTHDTAPLAATARARRLDGGNEQTQAPVTIPGVNELRLGPGIWEVRVILDGYWTDPIHTRDDAAHVVHLFSMGVVRARAASAKALTVQFTPLDAGYPSAEVGCEAGSGEWLCPVPAGRYDLRFMSSGSAPEFRWAVNVASSGRTDLGKLDLTPGAALFGRVSVRNGSLASAAAEVLLAPAGQDPQRSGKQNLKVKVDPRGMFLFKSLAPGDYVARAIGNGLTSRSVPIRILDGKTAELTNAFQLDRAKRLTLNIMPTRDAQDRPWRVVLLARDGPAHSDIVTESEATAEGEWSYAALTAGDYQVSIRRSGAGEWKALDVSIDDADVTLPVSVLGEVARGRLTLGGKPLAATLHFGGEFGQPVQSDDAGNFAGLVPPPRKDEWTVLIESETPSVRRTVDVKPRRLDNGALHFEIKLPATTLLGTVVDDQRRPQAACAGDAGARRTHPRASLCRR
jgi:hypothetical protein